MPKILAEYRFETMPYRMRCTVEGCMYERQPSYQGTEGAARYLAMHHTSSDRHPTIVEDMTGED